MSLRSFFRLLRSDRLPDPASGVDDSLARTAKEAMHIRGSQGGLQYHGTEAVYKHIAKGHKNYTESFDKED